MTYSIYRSAHRSKRPLASSDTFAYLPRDHVEWVQIPGWHDDPVEARLVAFDAVYPKG
jgi:hypothetical protein